MARDAKERMQWQKVLGHGTRRREALERRSSTDVLDFVGCPRAHTYFISVGSGTTYLLSSRLNVAELFLIILGGDRKEASK